MTAPEPAAETAHTERRRPWDGFGSRADGSPRDSVPFGGRHRPRILDVCCCQGGAAKGYADAGFEVVGVDIDPQPNYPYTFHRANLLNLRYWSLNGCVHIAQLPGEKPPCLGKFDAVHFSPPCQAKSRTQKLQGNDHPRLIAACRRLAQEMGVPYVIENVIPDDPGNDPDPLIDPVMLCGSMFGLSTYRHRLFESNVPLTAPEHPQHVARTTKMGRPPRPGEFMHIVGNFSGVDQGRVVMGMPWATRDGLREAIPPAYSEFVGHQLMAHLNVVLRPGRVAP